VAPCAITAVVGSAVANTTASSQLRFIGKLLEGDAATGDTPGRLRGAGWTMQNLSIVIDPARPAKGAGAAPSVGNRR